MVHMGARADRAKQVVAKCTVRMRHTIAAAAFEIRTTVLHTSHRASGSIP